MNSFAIAFLEYRESGFANKMVLQRIGERRCFDAFDEAVEALNSEPMWGEYVQCVLNLCEKDPSQPTILGEAPDQNVNQRLEQAYMIATKAHAKRKLSSDLYSPVVEFLVKHGHLNKARIMLSKISAERNEPAIILTKIRFFLLHSATGEVKWNSEKLFLTAYEIVNKMTPEQESEFWRMWIEFAIVRNKFDLAKEIATTYSSQSSDDVRSPMLNLYLKWITANSGISTAYRVNIVNMTLRRSLHW